MKAAAFQFPMKKREAAAGWIYLFIHTFLLADLLSLLSIYVLDQLGLGMSDISLNVTYYAVSFAVLLILMFNFMRKSFSDLCDNIKNTLISVILGYFIYILASEAIHMILSFFMPNLVNPNNEAIIAETKLNPNAMIVTGVLLAPVVEEILFRGIAFGTVRKKSAAAAYIVSTLAFSVYHLWVFFLTDYDWTLFLYLCQYIPAGIVLGWCYEKSRNIWAPIFLHMTINLISVYFSI